MKEQFHIVLITVGLFAAGLLMGVWTQKTRPIPPPPAPVLGEFGQVPAPPMRAGAYGPEMGGFAIQRFSSEHPATIVTMNRNISEMEPKIKEFQGAVDSIEKEFRQRLDKVLTPEQQKNLASIEAEEAPQTTDAGFMPPPPPLPIEEHGREGQPFMIGFRAAPFPFGGWRMMSMIIYQPSLDHLASQLKLDPAQQAIVKQLMQDRRTNLLALIDKNPPPTLGFGQPLP